MGKWGAEARLIMAHGPCVFPLSNQAKPVYTRDFTRGDSLGGTPP
jgi:hypothetical protein